MNLLNLVVTYYTDMLYWYENGSVLLKVSYFDFLSKTTVMIVHKNLSVVVENPLLIR